MAKKKIEIEEVTTNECCGSCENCTCNEEKKSKKTGKLVSAILLLISAATGAGAYFYVKKKKDNVPQAMNDLFRAPAQPVVPHVENELDVPEDILAAAAEVIEEVEVEEVVEEAPVSPIEEPAVEEPVAEDEVVLPPFDENATFVGNYDTKVFHTRDCGLGNRIADNKKVSLYSVEEAFAEDYKPCGRCKPNGTGDIICNTESMVFHNADCGFAARMLDDKKLFMKNREAAIAANYKPCGRCKP